MQLNKQKIIRLINQNIEKLKQRYPIKSIALYGSYARGEQDSSSDIDLLVDFTQPIGMEIIDLTLDMEKILNSKVDIVTYNAIKNRLFKYIKDELVYA